MLKLWKSQQAGVVINVCPRYDEYDSSGLEPERKQKALDLFQTKMNKTKEQIKHEQNSRDANVDEYLR